MKRTPQPDCPSSAFMANAAVLRSKRCVGSTPSLIDLQDAGVRFYTYETVVRYFLEVAGQTGTDIVVLDRPNPIGGGFVQGPISDAGQRELRQCGADTGASRHDVG